MMKSMAAVGLLAALGLLGGCSSTTVVLGPDGTGAAGQGGGAEGGAGLGSGGTDPGTPPACPAGQDLSSVAPAESAPSFIALDATHVYWSSEAAIRRVPREGGAIETLADAQPIPMGLAVDEGFVYWANHNDPSIRRVPKTGGQWSELAVDIEGGGAFSMVVLDESYVYARGNCGEIVRIAKSGGPVEPVVSSEGCIGGIAIDEQWVYYAVDSHGGAIARVPKSGGVEQVLAPAEVAAAGGYTGGAPGIAVDAERVVWMSSNTGRVLSVPKAGGDVKELATGIHMGQDVVTDGEHVYWSEFNVVGVVGVEGGIAMALAQSPQLGPMGLVLGEHHMFFTNYITTGPVMRVCR